MYHLDVTDDFYSFFSMDSAEIAPPFLSLQNTIKDGKLFIHVNNLIANISDPSIYNHFSSQNIDGIIAKTVHLLDLSHKFKDLEILLLNSVFVFSHITGVCYELSNSNIKFAHNIGNTSENQLVNIIDGKSLDFIDVSIKIKIYLSQNSKVEVCFKETDILIYSFNFNNLLEDKIGFMTNQTEEMVKLKQIEFTKTNIINLIKA